VNRGVHAQEEAMISTAPEALLNTSGLPRALTSDEFQTATFRENIRQNWILAH